MSTKVFKLGWFSDLPYGLPGEPLLRSHTHQLKDEDLKEMIIEYLSNGEVVAETVGMPTKDELNSKVEIGLSKVLTDGEMLWTTDLEYYVKNYNVDLPDEALAIMENNGWTVPALSSEKINSLFDEIPEKWYANG